MTTEQNPLPFGFTPHDGGDYIEAPDGCKEIQMCRDGELHMTGNTNYLSREMWSINGDESPDDDDVIGYFHVTSAQLAALPELLEIGKDAMNCRTEVNRAFSIVLRLGALIAKIGGER